MATHPTRDDIDLIDGHFYVDPHERYTWMRENAPVYFDAPNGVWGIASYAALLAMEKDPITFSNAGGIRPDTGPIPMMIDMDDPEHWKRRKLVNKGFTPRRVRDSEQKIRDVCDAIIDSVCERGECDFVNDIAAPLPMILIGDMLGVEPKDRGDLLRWSDDMLSALSGHDQEVAMVKAMEAMMGYTEFCTHAVAQRQEQATDDLMSLLVHAEVDGDKLSPDDILHESLLILIGGDETTRHVISGGVEQLMLNPDQRQILIDDPTKITVAVEEMLRWVTPIKNMCRTVTRDTEFMGQPMLAGQKCMLLFESANRDSTRFDRSVPLRRAAHSQRAPRVRFRCAFLSRAGTGPPRAQGDVRTTAVAHARHGVRHGFRVPAAPARQLRQRARIDAGPLRAEPATPEEHGVNNRELVEKLWIDLYNRDFDAVGAAFADDGEYTDMPTPADDVARGPEQIAARLRLGLEPLSGISHDIRVIVAEGDIVVTEHVEHWEWPSGERASLPFVSMHEARDGKLVRWWDYWDLATLMNSAPAWWVEHIMSESARIGLRDADG